MKEQSRIKLMVTILDRGRGARAVELFAGAGLRQHYATPGRGTANSDILDYLGLGETEKDVLLTLLPEHAVPPLLAASGKELELATPGKGILFTMPLSAVSGAVAQIVNREVQRTGAEKEEPMQQKEKDDLIVVVVNSGCDDAVMSAAKSAGARGGTILHGRRLGAEGEKPGGSGVRPEKDIVAILAPRELRQPIMEAVNREAGIATESHGVLFSLPVDEVIGLSRMER